MAAIELGPDAASTIPEIQLTQEEQAFAQDCLNRSRAYLVSKRLYKKLPEDQREYLALATAAYMANIPAILDVYREYLIYSMGIYDEEAYQDKRKLQDVETLVKEAEIRLSPAMAQGTDARKFYSDISFSLLHDAQSYGRLHPELPQTVLHIHAAGIGTLLSLQDISPAARGQIKEIEKRFGQCQPLPLSHEEAKPKAA